MSVKRGHEEAVHAAPFQINANIHFKGCREDEIMLAEVEREQLQKVLATMGILLERVEEISDRTESEEPRPQKSRKSKSPLETPKAVHAGAHMTPAPPAAQPQAEKAEMAAPDGEIEKMLREFDSWI